MKYYSEVLDKLFDTEEKLFEEERKHKEKSEKADDVKKILDEKEKILNEALKKEKEVKEVCKKERDELEEKLKKLEADTHAKVETAKKAYQGAIDDYRKMVDFDPFVDLFTDEDYVDSLLQFLSLL